MREASYTLSIALSGILVIPSALEFVKPLHIFGSVLIYNLTILIVTNTSVCGGDPFLYVLVGRLLFCTVLFCTHCFGTHCFGTHCFGTHCFGTHCFVSWFLFDWLLLNSIGRGENNYHGVSKKLRATESVAVPPRMKDMGLHLTSDMDLARLVFDEIDTDQSGSIEIKELGALLRCWGLPERDVQSIFGQHDSDHDGMLSIDEFYQNMKPIWTFGCKVMKSNSDHAGIFEARSV